MPVLRSPDGELYYEKAGDGACGVVLVHGGFCTHDIWTHQVEALRDLYTVVTFDLRGHGASSGDYGEFSVEQSAQDVHRLIDTLELGPSVVVGHSLGVRIALQAAVNRPENVLGIGLLDGMRLPYEIPPMPADDFKAFMLAAFGGLLSEKTAPLLGDQLMSRIKAADASSAFAYFKAIERWDLNELDQVLASIGDRTPALVVQSTCQDQVTHQTTLLGPEATSDPWLTLLAKTLGQVKIEIAAGINHFQMLEEPELINDSIRNFVESVR